MFSAHVHSYTFMFSDVHSCSLTFTCVHRCTVNSLPFVHPYKLVYTQYTYVSSCTLTLTCDGITMPLHFIVPIIRQFPVHFVHWCIDEVP